MFQTKQDETSEKNLNETKISNLSHKIMIIKLNSREEWMYIERTSTDRKYKKVPNKKKE